MKSWGVPLSAVWLNNKSSDKQSHELPQTNLDAKHLEADMEDGVLVIKKKMLNKKA